MSTGLVASSYIAPPHHISNLNIIPNETINTKPKISIMENQLENQDDFNSSMKNLKNSFNPQMIYKNGLILNYKNQISFNSKKYLSQKNANKIKTKYLSTPDKDTNPIMNQSMNQQFSDFKRIKISHSSPPQLQQNFSQPQVFNQASAIPNHPHPSHNYQADIIPGMIPYNFSNGQALYPNLEIIKTNSGPENKYFNSLRIMDNIHCANKLPLGKYLQMKFMLSKILGFSSVKEMIPNHFVKKRESFLTLSGGADRNIWLTIYSDKAHNGSNIDNYHESIRTAYKTSANKILTIYNHKLFKKTYLTCKLNSDENNNFLSDQEQEQEQKLIEINMSPSNFSNNFESPKKKFKKLNVSNNSPCFIPVKPKDQYHIPAPTPGYYPNNCHPLSYHYFQPILFEQNVRNFVQTEKNIQNQNGCPQYKSYVYNNPATYNFYGDLANNKYQQIDLNYINSEKQKNNKNEDQYSNEKPVKKKRSVKNEKVKYVHPEIKAREVFNKLDYSKIEKGSEFYNKVSMNFSFSLKELLKYEEIVDDEISKRPLNETIVNIANLYKKKAFSRYIENIQISKNDFKQEYEQELIESHEQKNIENMRLDVRRIGYITKLIKETYGLLCTRNEIQKLFQTNRGYKKVKNMILIKSDKIENHILDQREH